jgi:intracellular multiplication protein IcmE
MQCNLEIDSARESLLLAVDRDIEAKNKVCVEEATVAELLQTVLADTSEIAEKIKKAKVEIDESGTVLSPSFNAMKEALLDAKKSAEVLMDHKMCLKKLQVQHTTPLHQSYDLLFSAQDINSLRHTAVELEGIGYSISELKLAGYISRAMKVAGFTARELKNAGYTAQEMKNIGYTLQELKDAGYTAKESKDAGYTAKKLKDAGYTANQKKHVGYTAKELKDAGYTAKEMVVAGCGYHHFIDLHFTRQELHNAGVIELSSQLYRNELTYV